MGNAAAPNIANLAHVLHLLRYGVDPSVRPSPAIIVPLEHTLDSFLSTLQSARLHPTEPVPLPPLEPITAAGIPTTVAAYHDAERLTCERRRLLGGFLADGGWPITEEAT